jgi:uncharacterized membrane protein YccC
MEALIAAGVAAVAAVIAALFTYRASTRKQKSDSSQQLLDQHQEDIKELRSERKADSQRIDRLERIARIQGDYIGELRRHIAERKDPPPPPYPTGLIT